MNFRLNEYEKSEFYTFTGIRGNEDIPVSIKFGKDNKATIEVPKRGTSSYNRKSKLITEFISQRISFNYIQAIRTDETALDVIRSLIYDELSFLENNELYLHHLDEISRIEAESLERIAEKLIDPLKDFLPQLNSITLTKDSKNFLSRSIRNDFDMIIDDGIPTSISYKGDGIKSLVALAILKDRKAVRGVSVIAIEEPESHLHSGAIHSLVEVINRISSNNQVIISTHNPLFVRQNKIKSNIIICDGTARQARNITEIREILGILPSDNLINATKVLVVEGELDKIILYKILSNMSEKCRSALDQNTLCIRSLGSASNLSHELQILKTNMCSYFVFVDHDEAGRNAVNTAKENKLLTDSQVKYSICGGSPDSEFEDAINPNVYVKSIQERYSIDLLRSSHFRTNCKWSDRVKKSFIEQGQPWDDKTKNNVKSIVADMFPEAFKTIDDVILTKKAGFIPSLVNTVEKLID